MPVKAGQVHMHSAVVSLVSAVCPIRQRQRHSLGRFGARLSHNIPYEGIFSPPWRLERNADTIGLWYLRDDEQGVAENLADAFNNGDIVGAGVEVIECQTGNCGNGEIELTEQCDDGNQSNEDGCTDQCITRCASLSFDGTTRWWFNAPLRTILNGQVGGYALEGWFNLQAVDDANESDFIGIPCGPRVGLNANRVHAQIW